MFKDFFDVSRSLKNDMSVYPGNEGFNLRALKSMPVDSSNLSAISMGLHTGTHIDAPSHFEQNGKKIDEISLSRFCGKVVVLDMLSAEHLLQVDDLKLYKDILIDGAVIFLKTKNSFQSDFEFDEKFCALSLEAAEFLASRKISIIGTDGPSIDRFRSGNHPAHHALFDAGVIVIEGLKFDKVDAGEYHFFAFPLSISGAEAAPARVVLAR